MSEPPPSVLNDLRTAVRQTPKPLIICGAGISMAATEGAAPSWAALLESGIARAIKFHPEETAWAAYARSRLGRSDPAKWIEVADEVARLLGGHRNAEFADWIEEQVGHLKASNPKLINAIGDLGCPVATTNYDDLLATGLGLPPITWRDHDQVHRFLTGKRPSILHLHGHWTRPETIVFGPESYAELSDDPHATLLTKLTALERPVILVGCSFEGIHDPDFTRIADFIFEWQRSAPRRYWLVRSEEGGTTKKGPDHGGRLYPVEFGRALDELPVFLESLTIEVTGSSESFLPALRTIDDYQPNSHVFGRNSEIERVVANLLSSRHTVICGSPGIGKTALATAILYDPRVVTAFGPRRIFVSLEGVENPRGIAAQAVDGLGLLPAGDLPSLLRQIEQAAAATSLVLLLDNAEEVFERDFTEAERVLRLIAQRPGVLIVMTLRGSTPNLPSSDSIDDLSSLDMDAARDAFLSISGPRFASDPELPSLLRALDGHPLSIELMAARAREVSNLAEIRKMWEAQHVEVLRRQGAAESRLTSVRASLAMSLKSSRIARSPAARRLLGALSVLPDGAPEDRLAGLLGSPADVSRAKGYDAVAILRALRLTELRPDRRVRMLNPLRESVRLDVALHADSAKRLRKRYLALALKGQATNKPEWQSIRHELDSEANNIEYVLKAFSGTQVSRDFAVAVISYCKYINATGRSIAPWIEEVAKNYAMRGDSHSAADILNELGRISDARSEIAASARYRGDALVYAKHANSKMAIGNALRGLGSLALTLSNHPEAMRYLTEALQAYQLAGDDPSIAAVHDELAVLARREGRIEEARTLLVDAQDVYEQHNDILGVANCLVERAQLDWSTAEPLLQEALELLKKIGAPASQSYCLDAMGHFELRHGTLSEALRLFRESEETSHNSGALANEASGLIMQGRTLKALGNEYQGNALINEGFSLWFDVLPARNAALPGWIAAHGALVASEPRDVERFMKEAETCWAKIGRLDLIEDWIRLKIGNREGEVCG